MLKFRVSSKSCVVPLHGDAEDVPQRSSEATSASDSPFCEERSMARNIIAATQSSSSEKAKTRITSMSALSELAIRKSIGSPRVVSSPDIRLRHSERSLPQSLHREVAANKASAGPGRSPWQTPPCACSQTNTSEPTAEDKEIKVEESDISGEQCEIGRKVRVGEEWTYLEVELGLAHPLSYASCNNKHRREEEDARVEWAQSFGNKIPCACQTLSPVDPTGGAKRSVQQEPTPATELLRPVPNLGPEIKRREELPWVSNAECLGSLLSLTMNIHTFIFFPLFLYKWAGAGLVVYILLLAVGGWPVLYMEILLTETIMTASSSGDGWRLPWSRLAPWAGGISTAQPTLSLFQAAQNCVLLSYAVLYCVNSFYAPLPWSQCQAWFGADYRCVPGIVTEAILAGHDSVSRLKNGTGTLECEISNLTLAQCHLQREASYIQFWERYILQSDQKGLRVLGELGDPSKHILAVGATVWAVVGSIHVVLGRHIRKLALASVLVLISLCLGLGLHNLRESPSVRTFFRSKFTVVNSSFLEVDCWREAALLIINGLSLVNGTVPAYASSMEASSQRRLISIAVVLFHILFLVAVSMTTIPLLPQDADMSYVQHRQAIGYFPLAAASANFAIRRHGSGLSCLFYLSAVLSGFHSLLGAADAGRQILEAAWPRLKVVAGVVAATLGLCLTLPLCFSTGFSLMAVYERYGIILPSLCLGWAELSVVFWWNGVGKLSVKSPGPPWFRILIKILWFLCPLFVTTLALEFMITWPPLHQPAPLPTWIEGMGAFLSSTSLLQVVVIGVFCALSDKWKQSAD